MPLIQPAAVLIVTGVLPGVSDQFHLQRNRRRLRLRDAFGPFDWVPQFHAGA
jgi:hypothetical protein